MAALLLPHLYRNGNLAYLAIVLEITSFLEYMLRQCMQIGGTSLTWKVSMTFTVLLMTIQKRMKKKFKHRSVSVDRMSSCP